jgi:hypothetical protein
MIDTKKLILPLGGCTLNDPFSLIVESAKFTSILTVPNHESSPSILFQSSSAISQFLSMVFEGLQIPEDLMKFCYGNSSGFWDIDSIKRLQKKNVDIVLMQLTTPFSLIYNGVNIDIFQFDSLLLSRLIDDGVSNQLVQTYRKNLLAGVDKKIVDNLDVIFESIDKSKIQLTHLERALLETVRVKRDSVDEMFEASNKLLQLFGGDLVIIHYNFMYMPDGRPVCWPSTFRADIEDLAKRLDVRTYDFSDLVAKYSVDILQADLKSWNKKGLEVAHKFILELIN